MEVECTLNKTRDQSPGTPLPESRQKILEKNNDSL